MYNVSYIIIKYKKRNGGYVREPTVAGVYKFKLSLKTYSERLYNGINCKY